MTQYVWQRASNGLTYDDNPRPECLALLERAPMRVLDIGCNVGSVGRELKRRYPDVHLVGCEFNAQAAEIAAKDYHLIIQEDVTKADLGSYGIDTPFDMVCLFDVLEHLYNPWELLQDLQDKVSDDAQVLVSLPNASNLLVLLDAVRGHWRYQNYGLLDFTHIRYFTDFDARKMFYQTGFRVKQMQMSTFGMAAEIYHQLKTATFPTQVTVDKLSVQVESVDDLLRLCAVQNLYHLTPHRGQVEEGERHWMSAEYPPTFAFGG
ncbi:class I SAM-dependent methyltransferase [Moraxella sp. FZFQ2102]|uniref:class I SAM-dependent methyltransferase n=1 Tax=Moraxella sp. FZFQ2102 TaxID=2953752 RepID=UPI00209BF2DA|nr:class I SAM-dependent methyltransferase [Moraxella sp. FZFQ2102]USZ15560.1 class I SAM-dependent methyltransferase [Moraxella sp. FZFQ2102]